MYLKTVDLLISLNMVTLAAEKYSKFIMNKLSIDFEEA